MNKWVKIDADPGVCSLPPDIRVQLLSSHPVLPRTQRGVRKDIGQISRKLCELKGVEILEAAACPDHIHMLVSIPPKMSVSQFMGYLKGKSSLMLFDRNSNLKQIWKPSILV